MEADAKELLKKALDADERAEAEHDAETQQQFCQHITECQQRREQDAEYIAEREKHTGLSPWQLDDETPEINDIIDAIEWQGGFVEDRARFELLHSSQPIHESYTRFIEYHTLQEWVASVLHDHARYFGQFAYHVDAVMPDVVYNLIEAIALEEPVFIADGSSNP